MKIFYLIVSILILYGSVQPLFADWSPPVLLWEDQPGGFELPAVDAAMAVDAEENVHIVFTHGFVNSHYPHGPAFTQLSYVKFDPWGRQLVPETMLSDSVAACSYPRIGLFGMDSLWVVWFNAGDFENEPHGIATRSLDLNGNLLRPATIWTDSMFEGPLGYAFDVLPDRSVVLAFSDVQPIIKTILMIHQRPDGTRILDHVPIFRNSVNGEATDGVKGYADTVADSLQIIWREAHLSDWIAVYGKRASLLPPPVDTTNLGGYAALTLPTPGHQRGPSDCRPIGDSLIVFADQRFEGIPEESFVHVLRKSDYSEISQTVAGVELWHAWTVEPGDSIISMIIYPDMPSAREQRFKRFRIPNLECVQDSLIFPNEGPNSGKWAMAYTVSPTGERHLVYDHYASTGGLSHLFYMCWRSDLSVGPTPTGTGQPKTEYTITPNPASSHFTIVGPLAKATSIKLYNVLGQQVGREIHGAAMQTQTYSYATDNLPGGVYFLHIATPTGTTIQKVLLIH